VQPVTLVTGASAGLGAEFARQCARRGDKLVLVARRRERLDALAGEVGGAHVIAADLAAAGAAARLIAQVESLGLAVEVLINNAGFGLTGQFAQLPLEGQLGMVDLNVRTLTELARLAVPGMVERRRGGILNVASTAAFQPGPGFAVYFATKAYVLSLTEALHQELKGTGVNVSALCPGPTRTEFGSVAGMNSKKFDRLSADAAGVVAAGLGGLESNKAVVVPGLTNKISAQSSRIIPRAAMRRIVASLKI